MYRVQLFRKDGTLIRESRHRSDSPLDALEKAVKSRWGKNKGVWVTNKWGDSGLDITYRVNVTEPEKNGPGHNSIDSDIKACVFKECD